MELTASERAQLAAIQNRLDALRQYLDGRSTPSPESSAQNWFDYLLQMKRILGNASNSDSFVACLMAKEYLSTRLPMRPFDVALKPQGAPGLDIEASTEDGKRVVGEVKTTIPYNGSDLGAAQQATFRKDFDKLRAATADHKYFFVTDGAVFRLMQQPRYARELPGITVVLLTTGEEHDVLPRTDSLAGSSKPDAHHLQLTGTHSPLPNVPREELIRAIELFDSEYRHTDEWTGWEEKANHKYAISYNGRRYPVKAVIRLATGAPSITFSGGYEANTYVQKRGFSVVSLSPGAREVPGSSARGEGRPPTKY